MDFSELCKKLSGSYPSLQLLSEGSLEPVLAIASAPLSACRLANAVLVIREEELAQTAVPTDCLGVICIGPCPVAEETSFGLAQLLTDEPAEKIFHAIQSLLNSSVQEEEDWIDLLQKTLDNADIQSIISRAGRILGNPITFGDYSSKLIARTGDVVHGSILWEEHSKYGFFTYETLHSPNYAIMMNKLEKTPYPVLIQDGISSYKTMNLRVKANGTPFGLLCALDANHPFTEKDKDSFMFLASVLGYYYRQDSFYRFVRDNRRDIFYKELIEGSLTDIALLRKRAKAVGIPTDTYCCVAVVGSAASDQRNRDRREIGAGLQQLQNKLEWFLPRSHTLIHRQTIIAIIATRSSDLSWSNSPELCGFLKENGLSMGISRITQGIEHTLQLYKQASGVRNVRIKGVDRSPITLFDQYPFHCLFQRLPSNVDIDSYCSKPLKALISYDELNNTDYIDTLLAFLKNSGNATNTAKALFIHRSSLIYRLKRIEEVLGMSLDDYAVRQSLTVSFMILGY